MKCMSFPFSLPFKPTLKFSPALRDALIASFAVFMISVITGYVVYTSASAGLKSEVQGNLLNIAQSAAGLTDVELYKQITQPEHKNNPTYKKVVAPYYKLLAANPNIAFIYSVVNRDNKVFFILDSKIVKEGEKDDTSGVMEEYTDGTDIMKQALFEQKAMVEDEPYSDDWGTFLSGYAPLYDAKGGFVGIVGADIRVDQYLERLASIRHALFFGLGIAFLASIAVGFAVFFIRRAMIRAEAKNEEQRQSMAMMEIARVKEQEEQRKQAEIERKAAMAEMAQKFQSSFEGAIGNISGAASRLENQIEEVLGVVEATQQSSTQAGNFASTAAQNSGQISAATTELTASIREICEQTEKSSTVAQLAAHKAQETKTVIETLSQLSEKVSNITIVITKIAGQINLLALNAAIESARAGEYGKGFSVVANEVKTLANQVSEAASGISTEIEQMRAATKSSVESVLAVMNVINDVSESTRSVSAAVEEQSAVTNEIAHTVSQAADSAQHISENVAEIQNGAEKTQSSAMIVLEATKDLGREAGVLKTRVDEFLRTIRA